MKTNSIIASLTIAFTSLSLTAHGKWMTDFEAAKKKAAEEKKDILVDFTGSDWCHWCIKLKEEVFDKEEFTKGVADKYVLLELDYPNDKSKQSEELQKQNKELQQRFAIKGFPTILILDDQGRPFASTGYAQGGPTPYLANLEKMRQQRVQRDDQFAAAKGLEGLEKAETLHKGLSGIPVNLHQNFYPDTVAEIIKLDPENKTGYATVVAKQKMEQSYTEALYGGKMEEALKIADKFIETNKLTGESLQEVLAMKMDPLLRSGRFEDSEKILSQIIEADAETELGKFATGFKPRLAEMKKRAAESKKAPKEKTEEAPKEAEKK